MRKTRHELTGVPAALLLGSVLVTGLIAAWITMRLLLDWAGLSGPWSAALLAIALALTAVSFPVWFSLAFFYGICLIALLRRPRARRALSRMADQLGVRAGTVIRENWGGDGAIAGLFRLSILVVVPGDPEDAIQRLTSRAVEAGHGEAWSPVARSPAVPGAPRWEVAALTPSRLRNLEVPIAQGFTALEVTLTEPPR